MRLTIRNSDGSVSQPYPCDWEAVMNKLAEYEDLDEQGRLIKLPCKVGDTVYSIQYKNVHKCKTSMYLYSSHGLSASYTSAEGMTRGHDEWHDIDEIGKTVFFTREEAEAALKGAER